MNSLPFKQQDKIFLEFIVQNRTGFLFFQLCFESMYSKHINEDNNMFLQTIKGVRKFLNKLDDVFSIVFKQTNKKNDYQSPYIRLRLFRKKIK